MCKMRYFSLVTLFVFFVFLQACGGGGGSATVAGPPPSDPTPTPSTPVSSLTVSWDYYYDDYVADFDVKGVRVYIDDSLICEKGVDEIPSLFVDKTMDCDVSDKYLSTPVSYTLTAVDSHGNESSHSVTHTAS